MGLVTEFEVKCIKCGEMYMRPRRLLESINQMNEKDICIKCRGRQLSRHPVVGRK